MSQLDRHWTSLAVFLICLACLHSAQAAVHTSLNLRYTHPRGPEQGGTWTLVAKSDNPNSQGLTDLSARFNNMPAAGTLDPFVGGSLSINTIGSDTEFVYGQDPNAGLVTGVGLLGGPSDLGADPLYDTFWDNASVIATGSIADLTNRPSLVSVTASEIVGGTVVPTTIGTSIVRGDSVDIDGLPLGDVTRNFVTDFNDMNVALANYFDLVTPGNTWDIGDVGSDSSGYPTDNQVTYSDVKNIGQHMTAREIPTPDEDFPTPPGPHTISITSTSRPVTEEEMNDSLFSFPKPGPGTVFEFFVTTSHDIVSVDNIQLSEVPLYNDENFGSNTGPPNQAIAEAFPGAMVDSFINTSNVSRSITWFGGQDGDFSDPNPISWHDGRDDGPQTDFRFAQLTVPAGSDPNFVFDGRININVDGVIASQSFSFSLAQPGDFDLDGDVDGQDFLAWQRGESPTPFSAADLADWEQFYGTSPASTSAIATVPEPTTLAMALLAAIACIARPGQRLWKPGASSVVLLLLCLVSVHSAQAAVHTALNLHYTHPNDPNQGGTWTLVARNSDRNSEGIAHLAARFLEGTIPAAGTVHPDIGHELNGGLLGISTLIDPNGPDYVEFVYGQDPNDGLINDVGRPDGPSDQGDDPLENSFWNDASIIATGSFGSSRPTVLLATAEEILSGIIVPVGKVSLTVRGDSVMFDGLSLGDADRSWSINGDDLAEVLISFNSTGQKTWETGDFVGPNGSGSDGRVDGDDLNELLVRFNTLQSPPAIVGVPEPTTAMLCAIAATSCLFLASSRFKGREVISNRT